MAIVPIAGLYTLETNLRTQGFPQCYTPVEFPFHGIVQGHSGVGLNISIALTRLGHQARLATLLGPDDAGDHFVAALPRYGLTAEFISRATAATSQSVILVAPDGMRQAHCDLKDLQTSVYPQDQVTPLLAGAALAVICNINFARPLLAQAKAQGLAIATDVHVLGDFDDDYNAEFMVAADILFLSHERLPCSPEQAVRELRQRYDPRILVIGLGSDGALLSERGEPLFLAPAIAPRGIANTIGAGDALFSAFIDQTLRGQDARTALRRATLYAGWKIGENGAPLGMLDEHDFAQLCQRQETAKDRPQSASVAEVAW